MKRFFLAILASTTLLAQWAHAEDYPQRPVTIIVPFAAGGPTDTVARLLGRSMEKSLDQPVVIENISGSAGTIGAAKAAKAIPDGYTLLLHHIGQATSVAFYRKLPYDALDDFLPIGLITEVPMTFIARKAFPATTLKALIAYAKEHKEKIAYANAGVGSASHLCGMLFMSAIKTELTTVPYKGTGPAMQDLLSGQIDFMCDQTTNTIRQIETGKVKVYGVTTKTRLASLKDVPTMDEAGLPGFEIASWHGLYAPKGTPNDVIDRLVTTLQAALRDATLVTRFAELGAKPVTQDRATPEALGKYLRAEIDKWSPIIEAAGVYAD